MFRVVVVISVALKLACNAEAQETYSEGLARCSPIADEVERKACFAKLTKPNQCDSSDVDAYLTCIQSVLAPNAATGTGKDATVEPQKKTAESKPRPTRATVDEARTIALKAKASGAWRVDTSTSAMTDTLDVVAWIPARASIPARFRGNEHPELLLMCRDDRTSLAVIFAGHWFYDDHNITLRIDKQPMERQTWHASTTNAAAFSPGAIPMMKRLLGAQQLIVKAAPIGEPTYEATFSLTGIDQVIKAIRAACAW